MSYQILNLDNQIRLLVALPLKPHTDPVIEMSDYRYHSQRPYWYRTLVLAENINDTMSI